MAKSIKKKRKVSKKKTRSNLTKKIKNEKEIRAEMYKKIHDENAKVSASYASSSQNYSASAPSSYATHNINNNSSEKGAYDKFLDGNLDLATAFWVFGIFGSFIASVALTLIAEYTSKIFYVGFFAVNAGILACLWECAENYKKEKLKKKLSAVWGYLTQIFCLFGAGGLITTAYDIIKTL